MVPLIVGLALAETVFLTDKPPLSTPGVVASWSPFPSPSMFGCPHPHSPRPGPHRDPWVSLGHIPALSQAHAGTGAWHVRLCPLLFLGLLITPKPGSGPCLCSGPGFPGQGCRPRPPCSRWSPSVLIAAPTTLCPVPLFTWLVLPDAEACLGSTFVTPGLGPGRGATLDCWSPQHSRLGPWS